jgi:short-subunit dehydrogenase
MKYALVAGGSKGIGYAIAEALAKRNFSLILVGRHTEALIHAKTELEQHYHVQVEILTKDLTDINAPTEIADWCLKNSITLNMLCNVAGMGGANDYLKAPLPEMSAMVHLNIESEMALTYRLLPLLKETSPSFILNVASLAGFAPIPIKNVYSATKSAVIFFSYSLKYQLLKHQVSVSCLCPGPVFTKPEVVMHTIEKLGWFGKVMAVEPAKVGEQAVRGTLNRTMIIIPGFLSKIVSIFLRTLPKRWLAFAYYKFGNNKA